MGYTDHFRPPKAIGIERDERVVELWHRMLEIVGDEPAPTVGEKTTDLLVKLCSYSEHALTSDQLTVTSRMIRDWRAIHDRAVTFRSYSDQIDYRQGDYRDAPDVEATWFIDPPYQKANRRGYRFGGTGIDFGELAEWTKSRRGQVIVCEQLGADWLDFRLLVELTSHRGARSTEVIWRNDFTNPV